MDDKPLYQSTARFGIYYYASCIVIWLGVIPYLLFHYRDNPAVMMAIGLIMLIYTFGTSREMIIVHAGHFLLYKKRLVPVFSSIRKYEFEEIRQIEADFTVSRVWYQDRVAPMNKLVVTDKDGRRKNVLTEIPEAALREALAIIQQSAKVEVLVELKG